MSALLGRGRPAPTTGTVKKPLTLATSQALHVSLDGDALTLRNSTGRQRFPLARIAHIVCNRHAHWSGEALCACLSHGIPITWQDGHGAALGGAAPRLGSTSSLHVALEHYLELPDWGQRYGNWLRCRRMAVLCAQARAAAKSGQTYSAEYFAEIKRNYVYRGQTVARFPEAGLAWCYGAALQGLVAEQLLGRYWGYGGTPLELAEDMAGLFWAALNLGCGPLPEAGTARSRMLFFESWRHEHGDLLPEHLAHLARHVARESEAWH